MNTNKYLTGLPRPAGSGARNDDKGGYQASVFLKTPQGHSVILPTLELAQAIEAEWKEDPSPHHHNKPLTSLVATALDRVAQAKETYVTAIYEALERDVILFWESTPEALLTLQEQRWAPCLAEVNHSLGLPLKPIFSLKGDSLPPEEKEKVKAFLSSKTHLEFTGFFHLTTLLSSFCLTFLLERGKLTPTKAWDLAHLHEHYQRRLWGEDTEARLQEEKQQKEFFETVRFLELLG